jgi:hypothetical protein
MPLQATSGAASYDAFGGGVPYVPAYIEQVFSTYLYDGNSSTQVITNEIDLSTKGGLVWIKGRVGSQRHVLTDTNRGVNSQLYSNRTDLEGTDTNCVTAFNTTGFTLGANSFVNSSSAGSNTFVGWSFRKQPKFFTAISYTGDGTAGRTVSHNLGSTPGCMIIKRISSTSDWAVYHRSLGGTKAIQLNLTSAATTSSVYWNDTDPTSTVFTLGDDSSVNANGNTYIAYLYAHDAGGFGLTGTDNVISCGSFTTDGSGNATVNLGYEPQWVLTKPTNVTSNWNIVDSMRGNATLNGSTNTEKRLSPNTSDAEISSYGYANPTSTGFVAFDWGPSVPFIYIAIRRGPMRVPTVGTSVYNGITRTGTAANATVTGAGFPVDLLFSGSRNAAFGTIDFDRLRGATQRLFTYATAAEAARATSLTSFAVQDGYTVGDDSTDGGVNNSGQTYIYWNFRRAPSFFDEVCWSGAGANLVINHNLQAVPELIINKYRNGTSYGWATTAAGLVNPNTNYIRLNTNGAEANSGSSPGFIYDRTSTTFTVSSDLAQSGFNWVSYLFATCPGVSKVGSYTGNGSTQTINCGFGAGGARFVLIKRIDDVGDWYMYDTARGMTVLTDPYLLVNSTAAEVATLGSVTTVSTGFALNATILAAINTNAASYIFLAIA